MHLDGLFLSTCVGVVTLQIDWPGVVWRRHVGGVRRVSRQQTAADGEAKSHVL